jgi:MoaA/NifB/PqqE/SkfB family radical SAM enzyme
MEKWNIKFNWDIHLACNYKCPYCWFYGKDEEVRHKNHYPGTSEIISAWKRIYTKYGKVNISITGGEPFLYPDFAFIASEISKMHYIEIITNLSADISGFINKAVKENVEINPSFHPLFADKDEFIIKVKVLKNEGLLKALTLVAWPAYIKNYNELKDFFKKHGIDLIIQPFFGEYNGIRYPDGYNKEELLIIYPHLAELGGKKVSTKTPETIGKLCSAGKYYGVIEPNGNVRRCGGHNSSDKIVGNIFDDNFSLLKQALPCTSNLCPCNESLFLLNKQ